MDFGNLDISADLREKAKSCKTPEELLALAKSEGYKLSDDQMESISGGGWSEFKDGGCSEYLPGCGKRVG